MSRLTYPLEGGRRGLDCPSCKQAVRVDRHGDRLTYRCFGGCTEETVTAALEPVRDQILTEMTESTEQEAGATSWAPVDLGPVLAGEIVDPEPSMLSRPDGVCLLYDAKLHQGSGEPESCKGWLALLAVAQLLDKRQRVVYVDFEDSEVSIVARLRALGCSATSILDAFTYIRPHEPLEANARVEVDAQLALSPSLVVIDGVTEALTLHGLDLGDNSDVARWLELLPRPAARAGAAVLLIDHVVKDKENRGRFAIGAQHKLAGIDVAYSLEVIEPFGRGREGLVKVTVQKDRPGFVRQHAGENSRVADMRLRSDLETGSVEVELCSPDALPAFRPTVLMERIWQAVNQEPGISKRDLRGAVHGKNDAKDLALRLLVAEGFIDAKQDGRARRHTTLKPFTENTPEGDRALVPDRAPTVPGTDAAPPCPVPLPLRGARNGARPAEAQKASEPCPSADAIADAVLQEFPGSYEIPAETAA